DDFAPHEATREYDTLPRTDLLRRDDIAGVFLDRDGARGGDGIVVIGNPDPRGAPERFGHPRTLFTLARGEHGTWLINFRFSSSTGTWYYQQWSVNVGHFDSPPAPDAFLRTATRIVDEREYLH